MQSINNQGSSLSYPLSCTTLTSTPLESVELIGQGGLVGKGFFQFVPSSPSPQPLSHFSTQIVPSR